MLIGTPVALLITHHAGRVAQLMPCVHRRPEAAKRNQLSREVLPKPRTPTHVLERAPSSPSRKSHEVPRTIPPARRQLDAIHRINYSDYDCRSLFCARRVDTNYSRHTSEFCPRASCSSYAALVFPTVVGCNSFCFTCLRYHFRFWQLAYQSGYTACK